MMDKSDSDDIECNSTRDITKSTKEQFKSRDSVDNPFPRTKIIPQEPTICPDSWLVGGCLGSRNAILVFKSSALANPTVHSSQNKPGFKLHITYKVLQAETKLLAKLLDCHGVMEVPPNSSDFNLLWTGSHPKPGMLRSLAPHQRVNHFPRSYELTRKDRLYKNIERMQHAKGLKHFDFIPQTFVMPTEFRELCSTHHRTKGPWIVKPVASSRGRGIFIVETPNQVPLEEPVVVAKYISNPLLIAGHKCDIRLYVVVTSFDPLIIYIYEEGLVRFATVKYDASHKQLWNPCMHLCNYSINKYHSDYVKSDDPSAEDVGHKWTLSALLRHLKSDGKDTAMLMSQIEDVVIKAILASANSIICACKMFVPNTNNCFELFGFDILIDSNLKPWLLEVNLSPSLNCDSPLDVRLKSAMLADLLTLVGIPAVDPILRPASTVNLSKGSLNLKMKLSNCRRVHSADGLSNTFPKKQPSNIFANTRISTASLQPTPEETRILKNAKAQFERRGGFVRIFPALDSWAKYSQYLDAITGIPVSGIASSSYNVNVSHNYNYLLYTSCFTDYSKLPQSNERPSSRVKLTSMYGTRDLSVDNKLARLNDRQDRYERMLSRGHKQALVPCKKVLESQGAELHQKIMEMLKSGKKITLKKIVSSPEEEEHIEIVLKFLQKASNYLRTPYSVKSPSTKLEAKDRAAIVAKQLNDFLYLYNRETEMYIENADKSSEIPHDLYSEFLEHARERDLEEILIQQTTKAIPDSGGPTGFRGVLKCIPNVDKHYSIRPAFKPNKLCKGVKIATLS
ncbi:tubulin polyglutamylase TTLL5 isoform X2 [Cylas formicarius]|uniref:tubulin polyglutamylase TTLL5 isoform X2 n=1 Tax=Cylas formicarius TaxID=197179 RepID=UPI0029584D59|nr:tubulin polyglutamylase TTLL5 isoform X2 [Cylas formicarius]